MIYLLALLMTASDGLKHVLGKISTKEISVSITNLLWTISAMILYGMAIVLWGFQGVSFNTFLVICINGIIIAISMLFYVEGLKLTDISLAVPMLSLSPIITTFVNYFVNGELLKTQNIFGIFLVIVGIYLLYDHRSFKHFLTSIGKNRGAQYVFVTSCLWGVGAALDKYIVLQTNPQSYLFLINIVLLVIFTLIVITRADSLEELKANFTDHKIRPEGIPFLTGIVDAVAVLIQMFLFTIFNPAQVIAFKRTSLLFGEFFAAGMLKEKIQGRVLPTIVIIGGAVLALI